ncbi:DUF5068 domain-containing protein [Mesobacillus zeae]|uniref:DUF5068 domain-containing protein n=1 Tax=Mesobacillus zeae TaxID=1917180 RepID=A0A398AWF2_9BACI|nr:DUF5068 domain-containing protein [Mesobacillus zeae]RID81915.1 DUF5068 domain-containing protein [Mesobacillus zeae]
MRKGKIISSLFLSATLLLTACGNDEEASGTKEKANSKPKTEEPAKVKAEKTEAKSEKLASGSNEVMNPNIEKESEGNVEVLYTNKEPNYSHDMNGFKVRVDEYQIVKVTDMNNDFFIEFDDQTGGYVITAKVTIDNTTKKAMYYPPNFQIRLSSESNYIPDDRSFVKEEHPKSSVEKESSKWGAGEKVEGLVSFTLTNEEYESLKSVKPKFVIEGGAADNDQFKGGFMEAGVYDFTFSEEQAKEAASAPQFYPDELTMRNMADKKMIFEKSGINQSKQIDGVKVTLEGVQYTEITPGEEHKERFRNFGDSGIVALTVKLKLDNQTEETITPRMIVSKVAVDKNRGNALSEGMVEPSEPREIKAGEQGEKYHVFLFRKDEFGLYKSFNLQFGPLYNGGEKLFKGKTVTYSLPR